MSGRKRTRKKITAACNKAGIPPPEQGESLTPLLEQAQVLLEVQRDAKKARRAKSDVLRKSAGIAPISHKATRKSRAKAPAKAPAKRKSRSKAAIAARAKAATKAALAAQSGAGSKAAVKAGSKAVVKAVVKAGSKAGSKAVVKRKPRAAKEVLVSMTEIKKVLKTILLNTSEPGTARIKAAETLLQMDGTAPEYQKAILEIRLTATAPNQYEKDLARHRAKAPA